MNRVAGELQNICQQMEEASGNNMQADERVRQKEAQIADLRQQMDSAFCADHDVDRDG